MDWDQYAELMVANGHKVYAAQVGHHGVYEGVKRTSPTIYPHRLDTHEMRFDWVMKHEVWPPVKSCRKAGYKCFCFWLEHKSPLLQTMIGDITRQLATEGYQVSEQEHPENGRWLEISWTAPISA